MITDPSDPTTDDEAAASDPDASDEPAEDPRAKALRLKRQRNTGPPRNDRAPRQLGVDGPP